MGKLTVLDGGLFTTVQDAGRQGYRKFGVPVSGVMDSRAFELGNRLVGNQKGAAVLEFTLKGGSYRFESEAMIVLTGADMKPALNGNEMPMNESLLVKPGDTLVLNYAERGCRSYLSIKGGFAVEEELNSSSTYTMGKFGGLSGRSLQAGDVLKWRDGSKTYAPEKAAKKDIPYYSSKITFSIMEGPEWSWLSESEQINFLNSDFEAASESNRMGIRLKGNEIKAKKAQMTSSAVLPGIIQLPENGHPIILAQDGQTIGGYPRIAKILDQELWRLGQVRPGDQVRFAL